MIKYKCPECKATNEEKIWNKSTAKHYDEAIFELNDFPDCNGCDFRCPSCGKMIMREDIEKVEQMTTEINIDYYEELKSKADKIEKAKVILNNVKYFGLCQSTERILFNLIHDLAHVFEIDENELGLEYIEEVTE